MKLAALWGYKEVLTQLEWWLLHTIGLSMQYNDTNILTRENREEGRWYSLLFGKPTTSMHCTGPINMPADGWHTPTLVVLGFVSESILKQETVKMVRGNIILQSAVQ